MPDSGGEDVLRELLGRPALIELLETSRFDRNDVESALSVSRSTAHRVVHSLRDRDLVTRENGFYTVTPLGEVVAREAARSSMLVRTALEIQPLLDTLDDTSSIDVDWFTDAQVMRSTDQDQSIEDRLVNLVSDAETIRYAGQSVVGHRFLATILDRMTDDTTMRLVATRDVVEFVRSTHPAIPAFDGTPDGVEVHVTDSLPLLMTLGDDRVCIGIHDTEHLGLSLLVETTDSEAFAWATDYFERLVDSSTEIGCQRTDQE